MGKKYIIELEDENYHQYSDSEPSDYLWRVKGFNALVFDEVGISKLTPYTEPDLGRVRKEAYKIGYEKGYRDGVNRIGDAEDKIRKEAYADGYNAGFGRKIDASYQEGLSDAWEAARKICTNWVLSDSVLSEIFGMDKTIDDIMKEITASEAIEKIRQYEQEKEEEIQVGDEVELKCGVRPAIYMQGTKGSDEIYLLFNDGSCGVHSKSEIVRKTGRHFHEIATILENMRGEQDG